MINNFLNELLQGESSKALAIIEKNGDKTCSDNIQAMLRLAILKPGHNFLYYQRLYNAWNNLTAPSLKPNSVRRKIVVITDFTADNLPPLISLFCGAMGVETEVILSAFDSVEQTILDSSSILYSSNPDIVIWIVSDKWFQRYTGKSTLISNVDLDQAKETFVQLISAIKNNTGSDILVTNLPGQSFPLPSGTLFQNNLMGTNLAISNFNIWLSQESSDQVKVVDLAGALFREGGGKVIGRINYLRARMAYEPLGTLAVSRELASGICHLAGKTHRALVVDWDNTIWGGEVAEVGSLGVECGFDTPDALGFRTLQENIKAHKAQGTLLAAVSRNDPGVKKIFKENSELVLKEEDFSSIQLGWHPKSHSISQISEDLGFGPEFMVFMDDNIFELAQVLTVHPYIDIVLAGPAPDQTLERLTSSHFCNMLSVSDEDLKRSARGAILRKQRELKVSFDNVDDFLKAINIRLNVSPLSDKNMSRVVQMFQKSNQFNLTTRRHREVDLVKLKTQGGTTLAFSYEDNFGTQGIIAAINLIFRSDHLEIESWVMSCRVLNRTIEQAIFSYILEKANGIFIQAEYIPTEKNGLVKTLYKDLGFHLKSEFSNAGLEHWTYSPTSKNKTPPIHFAKITEG